MIGIDTGVNTGIAIWDVNTKQFLRIDTVLIHEALLVVLDLNSRFNVKVRVEDARKRQWFGNSGKEKLQGAGSVKRDAKIWEDFLNHNKISFEMVAPKNNRTKLDSISFNKLTKYTMRTTSHSRDAAMLVYQF